MYLLKIDGNLEMSPIQQMNPIRPMLRIWAEEKLVLFLQAGLMVWRQNCATQDATWDE